MKRRVKEIILEPGRAFSEFTLLPGYTGKDCNIQNISLETKLAENLTIGIPFLSAAMTSVTGYDMALALGKERGIGVLPARLPTKEQAGIVDRIKNHEIGFVEKPITAQEDSSIEEVIRMVEIHGHSKIPIVDEYRVIKGMFILQHYWEVGGSLQDRVTSVMISFNSGKHVPNCNNPNISIKKAKSLLESSKENYLVVLDNQNRLVKLAFTKDIEKINVASAISTHKGWQDRVRTNVEAGTDLIVIDTADAYNYHAVDVIRKYKKMGIDVPICAGNVITYEGAMKLIKEGADIVKVGMSTGSICTTAKEKAVGRAPMAALIDVDKARQDYFEETKRYVPLIIDGGVSNSYSMAIALKKADAIMMGNYFNRFYESSGEKQDGKGEPTTIEDKMEKVVTYGEGSERAHNLPRYGHTTQATFFPEGEEGTVKYEGRLKPYLKADILRIKAALVNAGCMNLKEFRENAVIEVISDYARGIVSDTHDMEVKN